MASEATITVRLFARLREVAGRESLELPAENLQTVADVRKEVAAGVPELQPLLGSVMLARNGAYCQPDERVNPGDEVALIPPVSGG